jgi:hypothetical protein
MIPLVSFRVPTAMCSPNASGSSCEAMRASNPETTA